MALLEKMRKKMGWLITVLIAIALLAFIIDADTFQSAVGMFSSKYNVGKIGGKSITYSEFQKQVDYFSKIYEITSNGSASNEQTNEMINESAWQNVIGEQILMPACKKAGLGVGDEEMIDMTQGVDISPFILSNGFADANGNFAKEQFLDFVNNIEKDNSGNLRLFWNYLQDNMVKERMFTKYLTLLEKSDFVNALQLDREIAENNTSYSVDFVVNPISYAVDSTIVVSNNEIKSYYNKVKNSLFQQETREADLVAFEIVPSETDKERAKTDIERLYPEFTQIANVTDLKNFLYKHSDMVFDETYYKKGDLTGTSALLDDFVATAAVGSLLEPQPAGDNFVAAKIMGKAMVPDSLFVKYMPASNSEKIADSLMNAIKKDGFEKVAMGSFTEEYLAQLQPGQEVGEIGWITKDIISSSLPKEFNSLFNAKVGEPAKMLIGGNYVIAMVGKTSKPIQKTQAAILLKNAVASQDTYSRIYQEANSLVEKSGGKLENFIKETNEKGYDVIPVSNIAGGQKKLANYDNMKEVSRWIYENEAGKVSPVFSVDNKYFFVAAVTKVNPQGLAPMEQVAQYIKSQIESEKKVEKLAEEAKKAFGDNVTSLEEVAEKYNTTVSSQNGITFSSVQSYGQLDPKFIGAVAAAGAKGETNIVGPVKGAMGIYYFQIKDKEKGAYYSESDAATKRSQIAKSLMSVIPQLMLQDNKTQDTRYKFY